jgi:hypothetical protein
LRRTQSSMDAPVDLLLGDGGEEALDLIDP